MSNVRKVRIKATGQELSVIKPKEGNQEVIEMLQDAIQYAREGKVTSCCIALRSGGQYWTDFSGPYDELSAGSALLATRINEGWNE